MVNMAFENQVLIYKFLIDINVFTVARNALYETLQYWTLEDKLFLQF